MGDQTPPHSPPSPPPNPSGDRWAKVTLYAVVLGFISLNIAIFIHSCGGLPGRTLEQTAKALADVASAFRQGRVKMEFLSYATSISNHQHFQFATLKQKEVFTRTEETSIGFGYIPLPGVVVEARAPVEYTYYLDLNDRWEFVLKDGVVSVFAPAIRFNKPAVDASAITYEVRKGYLKTAEAQENLKLSITSLVHGRARENIALVRENGRRQTTEFIEQWLLKSFADGKQYPVKVYFADERPPNNGVPRVNPQ